MFLCVRDGLDRAVGGECPGRGVSGRQGHDPSVPAGMELFPVSLTGPKSATAQSGFEQHLSCRSFCSLCVLPHLVISSLFLCSFPRAAITKYHDWVA